MGTSSAFTGPTKNPLLPDDFDDNSWQNAKSELSKFITGKSSDIPRLFGKYVKASGGKTSISQKASGGKAGLINTINFLNQINQEGITETLRSFRISMEGKSSSTILSEIVEILSPIGTTKEESVAREAIIDTMTFLYEFIEKESIEINQLNNVTGALFDELLSQYLVSYISGLLLKDLGYGVEKYADDPSLLDKREQELRDYVDNSVYVVLKDRNFNQNIAKLVDKIFTDAFEVLGGYYE